MGNEPQGASDQSAAAGLVAWQAFALDEGNARPTTRQKAGRIGSSSLPEEGRAKLAEDLKKLLRSQSEQDPYLAAKVRNLGEPK